MTKKLRKLEKENEGLKLKCEKMGSNVVDLEDEAGFSLPLLPFRSHSDSPEFTIL